MLAKFKREKMANKPSIKTTPKYVTTTKAQEKINLKFKEVTPEPKIEVAAADDEDSEYQIIPVTEIGPVRRSSGQRKQHKHQSRSRNAK